MDHTKQRRLRFGMISLLSELPGTRVKSNNLHDASERSVMVLMLLRAHSRSLVKSYVSNVLMCKCCQF